MRSSRAPLYTIVIGFTVLLIALYPIQSYSIVELTVETGHRSQTQLSFEVRSIENFEARIITYSIDDKVIARQVVPPAIFLSLKQKLSSILPEKEVFRYGIPSECPATLAPLIIRGSKVAPICLTDAQKAEKFATWWTDVREAVEGSKAR